MGATAGRSHDETRRTDTDKHARDRQVLHRWSVGGAHRVEPHRCHQPGDGEGRGARRARHRRRRRRGRRGGPQGVPDVGPEHRRRAGGRPQRDHRRVSEAHARPRRSGHRGDGFALRAVQRRPGADRSRSSHDGRRHPPRVLVQRRARQSPDRQGAGRRVRIHHAVELAAQSGDVQGGPGTRDGLHNGAQAVGGGTVQRRDRRRDLRRRRCTRGRVQPGQR